ncbi:MAG TPA: TonB-dependent receptor [Bacteroidia bacterium]|nr:TonB-dependent receptor [Bacteroidia bacterium]
MNRKAGSAVLFFTCLCACVPLVATGQVTKDTANAKTTDADMQYGLKGVIIISTPGSSGPGGLVVSRPDSGITEQQQCGTLNDLLGSSGAMFSKYYGANGLSSPGLRGSSPQQTPVVWNGLNLQAVTHGQVDLSLFPSILFDNVSVQPSGGSSLNGDAPGGGITGVSYTPYMSRQFRFSALAGSFGENSLALSFGDGKPKYAYDIKAFRQQAVNNFPFDNPYVPGNELTKLQHAGFFQQGAAGDFNYEFRNRRNLSVHSWVQETERDLPPTLLTNPNASWQHDYALRTILTFSDFSHDKWWYSASAAVVHNGLVFYDGYTQPASNTDEWEYVSDIHFRKHFGEGYFSAGLCNQYSVAVVTQFIPLHHQERPAAYLSFQRQFHKLQLSGSAREEMYDAKWENPVIRFGARYDIRNWIAVYGNVANTYRVPTFNELYWSPGGNPNLKPESSFGQELTVEFSRGGSYINGFYSATVYNRNVRNWILWVPGPAYWSPENVLAVRSRGIEHRLQATCKLNSFTFTLNGYYEFNRTTKLKTTIRGDSSLGLQMIYVPQQRISGMLRIAWKYWYVQYVHEFVDIRFTAADHSEYLPAFNTGQFTCGTSFVHRNEKAELFIRINNAWNTFYMVTADRPMPGRSYEVGVTFRFEKKRDVFPAVK